MDISNRTIHRNHLVCIYSMYSQSYTVFLSCNSTVLFSGGKKENASVTIVPIICFLLSFCSGLGVLRLNSLAKKSLRRGCHSWGFVNLWLFLTLSISSSINLTEEKKHTHTPYLLLHDHGSHPYYQDTRSAEVMNRLWVQKIFLRCKILLNWSVEGLIWWDKV